MKSRLYALDLLRFILAALVVILHFLEIFGYSVLHNSQNYVPIFGMPFFHVVLSRAVDVFFVLSGFTMVYSTVKKQSSLAFLRKRAARIFPLYILATIAAMPFFLFIPASSPQHKLFTIDYIVNSFILRPTDQVFLVSVAWTLSFEWVFYVIFAITMAISHKFRVHIVSALFTATMLIAFFFPYHGNGYASVLFDGRFLLLEFVAGMWIAHYYDILKVKQGWIYCTIGSILMYCTVFTPLFDWPFRGLVFVLPASLIVIGAMNMRISEKNYTLVKKLGDISYTMYIMHTFTAFAFAYLLYNVLRIQTHVWFWLIVSMIITVPVSLLVNRIIEKPLYNFFAYFNLRKKRI